MSEFWLEVAVANYDGPILDRDCSNCKYNPLEDAICESCDGVEQNNFQPS